MKNDEKVLFLTIKKYWFDKILSGEKTIEYREYKDYLYRNLITSRVFKDEPEIESKDHFD